MSSFNEVYERNKDAIDKVIGSNYCLIYKNSYHRDLSDELYFQNKVPAILPTNIGILRNRRILDDLFFNGIERDDYLVYEKKRYSLKTFEHVKKIPIPISSMFIIRIIRTLDFIDKMGFVLYSFNLNNIVFDNIDEPFIFGYSMFRRIDGVPPKKRRVRFSSIFKSTDRRYLSRRSSLISFGFIILHFSGVKLPWIGKQLTEIELAFEKCLLIKKLKNLTMKKYFSILANCEKNSRPPFNDLIDLF